MLAQREGEPVGIQPCLESDTVILLDVETTGFNSKKDRVIELGIIWIERSELVMAHSWTFDPGFRLPEEIIKLTGITQREVDRSPSFKGLAPFVVDLLEEPSVVVAYNSPFDLGFLKQEILRAGWEVPAIGPVIDPLKWVRHEDRGKKCNLSLAAKRRRISSEGAHRALADCWMTLAVMNTLKMPKTLSEALDLQKKGFRV